MICTRVVYKSTYKINFGVVGPAVCLVEPYLKRNGSVPDALLQAVRNVAVGHADADAGGRFLEQGGVGQGRDVGLAISGRSNELYNLNRNGHAPALKLGCCGAVHSPSPCTVPDLSCWPVAVSPPRVNLVMNAAVNRKRSRIDLDEEEERQPLPSPALSVGGDSLKKSRTQSELEELDVIAPEDAWSVDVASILESNTLACPPGSHLRPHNNVEKYTAESIIILCVQGNVQLHYDLLW